MNEQRRRDRIVVGIDEGAQSALAVEWAAREAEAAGLRLVLVHCETDRYATAVIDPGIVPAMELGSNGTDSRALIEDTVALVGQIAPGVDISHHSLRSARPGDCNRRRVACRSDW